MLKYGLFELIQRIVLGVNQFSKMIDIRTKSVEFLDDRWVSRRHWEVVDEEGVLVVRDLGSKYGTFVNGRPISQAALLPGDMLSVGLSNFVAGYEPPVPESGIFPRSEITEVEVDTRYQLAGRA